MEANILMCLWMNVRNIQTLNQSLLALEQDPENTEILNSIFRAAHTLKGASATMGFNKMSNVTHELEDVLSLLRQNELQVSAELVNVLFEALDLLEVLAQGIAEGREEDVEITGVIQNLQKFGNKERKAGPTQTEERRKTLQLRYLPAEIEHIKEMASTGLTLTISMFTYKKIVCSKEPVLL